MKKMNKEKECYYYHVEGKPRKIRRSKPAMISDDHITILHYLANLYHGSIERKANGDIIIQILNTTPDENVFADFNY